MEIYCPNIPAEDFDYLLSIPRSLKAFHWTGKAWTCHMTQQEEEAAEDEEDGNNESLDSGGLEDAGC